MSKLCYNCKQLKPLDNFSRDAKSKDGRCSYCKPCTSEERKKWYLKNKDILRDKELLRSYGIGITEYRQMLTMQASGCAICGRRDEGKMLAVDHCHETGRVRGLLCTRCNPGLGYFQDDPGLLMRATEYLLEGLTDA